MVQAPVKAITIMNCALQVFDMDTPNVPLPVSEFAMDISLTIQEITGWLLA